MSKYERFRMKQAAVLADTRRAEGIQLEEIDEKKPGHTAIALVDRDWFPRIYFVRIRPAWSVQEYFMHARNLMKEKGIVP